MMPVIRVSDSTWDRMKTFARPLEDTADDIVSRALDALEGIKATPKVSKAPGRPSKDREGEKLPQKEFRIPLLIALHELGGKASKHDASKAVFPKVKERLKPADHVLLSTGEFRWENAIAWERSELVKEGYLRNDSPRGTWELTDRGRTEASSLAV